MEHLSIPATIIFYLGPLPVTNTIFSAWITMAVLVGLSLVATRRMRLVPSGLQNLMEYGLELLLTVCETTSGRKGRQFFPVVATAFLFILASNWIGLFPGYGDTPWLRSSNSDLNVTASMAIIVFLLVQGWMIKSRGVFGYLKEFVVPYPLEILTQLSRPISLALRLFGNIIAGEFAIATITGMIPLALPMFFFGIEIFVGVIQALIFSMLTLVFLTIATLHDESEGHREGSSH